MKRLLLTLSVLVSFQVIGTDSTNYCAFIGSNTQTALQYTGNLISQLRKLKEETNCSVTDRSFQSLSDISTYFDYYLKNRSLETQIFKDQEELEKLSGVLGDLSVDSEEYVDVKTKMIEVKSKIIENEANLKISRDNQDLDFQKANIQNLVVEISNVISDTYLYEGCFEKDPSRAASIIGGMINLAGSVASLAGLNPLWAGVGKIVGDLTTKLGQAIRNYQWKYIDELDKTALFYNMMCMIEMQSNYYCEKQTEASLIKELMRLDFSGGSTPPPGSVWEGMQIQSESIPVFQAWIKRLYLGAPPANPEDAASLNDMLERINSAEGIISSANAMYREMLDDIEEGGPKYTLILNTTKNLAFLMTGYSTSMGSSVDTKPGTAYFNQRYNLTLMNYILVAPMGVEVTNLPECPNAGGCDRLIEFLSKYYGGGTPPSTDDQLDLIISNMEKNIKKITEAVSQDMDRDLLKRRLGDPGVLLAYSEIRDTVYDLSPREGLDGIFDYIQRVIGILRKYYDYRDSDEICINTKNKAGCPTPLREAIKSKNILQQIIVILDNNDLDAASRVKELSRLLQFKDNKTLLLAPKLEIILKKDLEARIKLGEITPIEDELIHLKRQNVLESLRKEGLENDKRKALDDRQRAMEVITYNLKSFIEIKPLRKSLLKEINKIKQDFEDGILISLDTYHESCAILLSTPYVNPNLGNGLEIVNLCKNSKIISEWNRIRLDLGLGILPELNLDYNQYYKKEFPERVCAYNTYQKKNIIYGLKDKVKKRLSP